MTFQTFIVCVHWTTEHPNHQTILNLLVVRRRDISLGMPGTFIIYWPPSPYSQTISIKYLGFISHCHFCTVADLREQRGHIQQPKIAPEMQIVGIYIMNFRIFSLALLSMNLSMKQNIKTEIKGKENQFLCRFWTLCLNFLFVCE